MRMCVGVCACRSASRMPPCCVPHPDHPRSVAAAPLLPAAARCGSWRRAARSTARTYGCCWMATLTTQVLYSRERGKGQAQLLLQSAPVRRLPRCGLAVRRRKQLLRQRSSLSVHAGTVHGSQQVGPTPRVVVPAPHVPAHISRPVSRMHTRIFAGLPILMKGTTVEVESRAELLMWVMPCRATTPTRSLRPPPPGSRGAPRRPAGRGVVGGAAGGAAARAAALLRLAGAAGASGPEAGGGVDARGRRRRAAAGTAARHWRGAHRDVAGWRCMSCACGRARARVRVCMPAYGLREQCKHAAVA